MEFAGFRIPEPAAAPVVKSWLSPEHRQELRELGDELSLAQRTILTARTAGKPIVLAASHGTGCRTALRWASGLSPAHQLAPDPTSVGRDSFGDEGRDWVVLQRGLPTPIGLPAHIPSSSRFHVHTTDLRNIRLFAPWRDTITPDAGQVRSRLRGWLAERRSADPVALLCEDAADPRVAGLGVPGVSLESWHVPLRRRTEMVLLNPPLRLDEWLRICAASGEIGGVGLGCTIVVDTTEQLLGAAALKWLLVQASRQVLGDGQAAVQSSWLALRAAVLAWDADCRFGGESAVLELVSRLGLNRGNAWVVLNAVRQGLTL